MHKILEDFRDVKRLEKIRAAAFPAEVVNAATDDDPFRHKTHGFETWFSPKSWSTNYVRTVP